MSKLKELRTAAGLTQKELAEKLGTTQQTVARWEREQAHIPTETLKAMAALFGSSVDELLGVERRRVSRDVGQHGDPHSLERWGTVTMDFTFGSSSYPLDYNNRNALVAFLSNDGLNMGDGWQDLDTTDGRCVFFNFAPVKRLRFNGPEVNCAILSIRWRGPREPDEPPQQQLSKVRVIDVDGNACEFPLDDANGRRLALFDNALGDIGANGFLPMRAADGTIHILNLRSVALIEVPLVPYYTRYLSSEAGTPAS